MRDACPGCGLLLRDGDHVIVASSATYHTACAEAPYTPPSMELLNTLLAGTSCPDIG